MKRPTIADVARRAGVSKGAVSYALNGQPGVSDATRQRILAIAREMGFNPNSAARVLSVARANAVGLTLCRPARILGIEPFFMELISGVEGELSARSYALTLQVVGGLTAAEIARMLLVPVATVQARITRAKKTLAAARVRFEAPDPDEWGARLGAVLGVVYLIFTEGYAATSGDRWIRADLAEEALRLGRVLAGLLPREPEVHGLVALMELQASRFAARLRPDGSPVLLADQDRTRWDRAQIARGRAALKRAAAAGRGLGPYGLQAAIAVCHAVAPSVAETDWQRIVLLYEALGRIAPSPVVELNRAVAVSMAAGPADALRLVDRLADEKALRGSHLLPSVRGELLARLGRTEEARAELLAAAERAANERERAVLLAKARAL